MPISNPFILFLLLAVLVLESSTTSTLKDPSSFPGSKHHRLKRADDFTGRLLTTDNDDVDDKKGPQIESRMGRAGAIGQQPSPIQSHRSNVATFSATGKVQGQPSRQQQPRLPDDGSQPPAPPIDVTDIRCMKMASRERFSAVISAPDGLLLGAAPVFEDVPTVDPLTSRVCQIQPTGQQSGSFQLEVTNLDACGVRTCSGISDGQPWLCLMLRFPMITGLKLPEDEIIEIRCKQQDRTVTEKKDIDFDGESFSPRVEQKSPVTFSGGRQEFLCEIGLFRRLPGTSLFSQRIGPGTAVELGEDVQLRSIVRSNDGWFYSKLTDVTIRRLKKKTTGGAVDRTASLVLPDGCRNPMYKAIATQHPARDARSSLLNNFNFRIFLFQDMDDGDSILVSARVIACVEAIDCAPSLCADDRGQGSGRRKKRSWLNETESNGSGQTREIFIEQHLLPNGTIASAGPALKGWETELALRVAMPGENVAQRMANHLNQLDGPQCFIYLMLTVGLATALGVTALLVTIYCLYNCKRPTDRKSTATVTAPPAGQQQIDTLMELQVLDAISRSVRQKKQSVHEEILKIYGGFPDNNKTNVYSPDPSTRKSLKQLKKQMNNKVGLPAGSNVTTVRVGTDCNRRTPLNEEQSAYWEIGHHQILPPTPV